MKIALFGGTFDPPHAGHVEAIVTALEKHLVDEVWVVPVFQNPLKPQPPTDAKLRREMVEKTFSAIPHTRIVYNELEKETLSYTIDTIRMLKKTIEGTHDWFFIVGSDAFSSKDSWKEIDVLEKELRFLVILREGVHLLPSSNCVLLDMPRIDVSSTDIRERVRNGRYVSHLIHPEVEKLIQKYDIYKL